jgi:hypothetical protein
MHNSDPGKKKPDRQRARDHLPPAGPHARRDLIDAEKTPGAGTLPTAEGEDESVQPTS